MKSEGMNIGFDEQELESLSCLLLSVDTENVRLGLTLLEDQPLAIQALNTSLAAVYRLNRERDIVHRAAQYLGSLKHWSGKTTEREAIEMIQLAFQKSMVFSARQRLVNIYFKLLNHDPASEEQDELEYSSLLTLHLLNADLLSFHQKMAVLLEEVGFSSYAKLHARKAKRYQPKNNRAENSF